MIATSILAKVDADRLQRGVEGLTKGAYAISITRNTASEISAFVANGDGQTYSVSLTEGRSFCACGRAGCPARRFPAAPRPGMRNLR